MVSSFCFRISAFPREQCVRLKGRYLMRKRNAYPIYLIVSGGVQLANTLIFTVLAVYYVTIVKMNPLQLVLVGTVLEATIFLCEVPTGVVADIFSRRSSIVAGMFVLGAAYLLEGAVP